MAAPKALVLYCEVIHVFFIYSICIFFLRLYLALYKMLNHFWFTVKEKRR